MAYKIGGLPAASTLLGSPLINNTSGASYEKSVGGPDCMFFEDDFIYSSSNSAIIWPWQRAANGAAASSQIGVPTAAHPGVYTLNTGTDTNGEGSLVKGVVTTANCILGGGYHELWFVVNINALASVAQDYKLYFGLGDSLNTFGGAPGANFCGFEYLRSASTNWRGRTIKASASTVASGGSNVAVATGWASFRMIINAGATSVSFYVNGTLIGTSAANIPNVAALFLGIYLQKSAGNTAVAVDFDYISWFHQLTTSRF